MAKVKKSTYILLIFFLGTWGIHKFFVNKIFQGMILLILFAVPFSVYSMEIITVIQDHNQTMINYLMNGLSKNIVPDSVNYLLKLLYAINTIWLIIDGIKAVKLKADTKGYIRI